jgi:hypothetical protein
MNKIVLNKPLLLNKRYIVYLDSDNKFSFSNKREAQDFITEVGRKMEEAILFITEKFNILEEFYRLYYLTDKDYKFKFQKSNSTEFLNNRLTFIQSGEGSPNHDTIIYHAIISCLEELETAFCIMQAKASCRKDTITKRRCALKIHLIQMYQEQLKSIGIKLKELPLQIKRAK